MVIEPLARALEDDGRATVRQSAAWALGEVKGDNAIPPLVTALKKDKQGVVRQEAAIALGKITGQKVIAPLVDALKMISMKQRAFKRQKHSERFKPGTKDLLMSSRKV